jgi:alpha-tubulin suppressor-like RCC1 family protein
MDKIYFDDDNISILAGSRDISTENEQLPFYLNTGNNESFLLVQNPNNCLNRFLTIRSINPDSSSNIDIINNAGTYKNNFIFTSAINKVGFSFILQKDVSFNKISFYLNTPSLVNVDICSTIILDYLDSGFNDISAGSLELFGDISGLVLSSNTNNYDLSFTNNMIYPGSFPGGTEYIRYKIYLNVTYNGSFNNVLNINLNSYEGTEGYIYITNSSYYIQPWTTLDTTIYLENDIIENFSENKIETSKTIYSLGNKLIQYPGILFLENYTNTYIDTITFYANITRSFEVSFSLYMGKFNIDTSGNYNKDYEVGNILLKTVKVIGNNATQEIIFDLSNTGFYNISSGDYLFLDYQPVRYVTTNLCCGVPGFDKLTITMPTYSASESFIYYEDTNARSITQDNKFIIKFLANILEGDKVKNYLIMDRDGKIFINQNIESTEYQVNVEGGIKTNRLYTESLVGYPILESGGFIASLNTELLVGTIKNNQIQDVSASKLVGLIQDSQIQDLSANKLVGLIRNDQIQSLEFSKITNDTSSNNLSVIIVNDNIVSVDGSKITGTIAASQITGVVVTSAPTEITNIDIQENIIIDSGAVYVSGGSNHSAFINHGGKVYLWGDNQYGQLGTGLVDSSASIPLELPIFTDISMIALGGGHTIMMRNDGYTFSFGNNQFGQLGDNTLVNRNTPVCLLESSGNPMITATQISAGFAHTGVISGDYAYMCGNNQYGQLGDTTFTNRKLLVAVNGGGVIKSVACGGYHTALLYDDGSVSTMGWNDRGQLGIGLPDSSFNQPQPVNLGIGNTAIAISCGFEHTAVLLSDGRVQTFGRGSEGQLGIGSSADQNTPVFVSGITNAISIACGNSFTSILDSSGNIKVFGSNLNGQLGLNSISTNFNTPQTITQTNTTGVNIGGGGEHQIILLSDGRVRTSGRNNYGQLGNSNFIDRIDMRDISYEYFEDLFIIRTGDDIHFIATNNKIGINIADPSVSLHVVGDVRIDGVLDISGIIYLNGAVMEDTLVSGRIDASQIYIDNNLQVDGSATILGQVLIDDNITINGNITASNYNLDISSINVQNNVSIQNGKLIMAGNDTLYGNTLGSNITQSSLTNLGILNNLQVNGNVVFNGSIDASFSSLDISSVNVNTFNADNISVTTNNWHDGRLFFNSSLLGASSSTQYEIQRGGLDLYKNTLAFNVPETDSSSGFVFVTTGGGSGTNQRLFIDGSNGNIAIGNFYPPTQRLDVCGNVLVRGNTNLLSGNSYQIAGNQVLNSTTLGSSVVNSSLTSLGTLSSLRLAGDLDISRNNIDASGINIRNRLAVGKTIANKTLDVSGDSLLTGRTDVNGSLYVNGTLITGSGGGGGFAGGDLDASNVRVHNNLTVLQNTFLNGNLDISRNNIDASGINIRNNLGIGLTNPIYNLDISTNNSNGAVRIINNGNGTAEYILQTGYGNAFQVDISNNIGYNLTPFIINDIGQVGIKTNNPIWDFDVQGTAFIKNLVISDDISVAPVNQGSNMIRLIQGTNNVAAIRIDDELNDTTPFIIDSSGNIGIGHDGPTYKLDICGGSSNQNMVKIFNYGNGDTFRIINNGSGTSFRVDDQTSDTTPFIINADGQVGINKSTPTAGYFLDVSGSILTNNKLVALDISTSTVNTDSLTVNGVNITTNGGFIGSANSDLDMNNYSIIDISAISVNDISTNLLRVNGVNITTNGGFIGSANSDLSMNNYNIYDVSYLRVLHTLDISNSQIIMGGNVVLTDNALGSAVTSSSLTSLGTLTSLNISGILDISQNKIDSSGINVRNSLSIGKTTATKALDISGDILINGGFSLNFDDNYNDIPFKIEYLDADEFTNSLFAVNNSGFVGIGTSNPVCLLDISSGNNNTSGVMRIVNRGTGFSFKIDDQQNDTTPFIVDQNGIVGINKSTPTPGYFLDVSGSILTNNKIVALDISSSSVSTTSLTVNGVPVTGGGSWSGNATSDLSMNNYQINDVSKIGIGTAIMPYSSLLDINVTGTDTGIQIINTGTGPSFFIQDESGDSTPFIINSQGNIGIGIDNPDFSLEICANSTHGGLRINNGFESPGLLIDNYSTGTGTGLTILNNITASNALRVINQDSINNIDYESFSINNEGKISIGHYGEATYIVDICGGNSNANIMKIFNFGSGDSLRIVNSGTGTSFRVDDQINDTTPFIIDAAGNVGIGKSNPSYVLDVSGIGYFSNSIYIGPDNSGGSIFLGGGNTDDQGWENSVIESRQYSGNKSELLIFKGNDISGSSGPDRIRLRASNIVFDTYPTTLGGYPPDRTSENIRMTIDESGNVGIGTSTPSYLLDINATGTSNGLRIINSGTGTSFRIDDQNNDTTPFIVDSNGGVGINRSSVTSGFFLDVSGNTRLSSGENNYVLRVLSNNTSGITGSTGICYLSCTAGGTGLYIDSNVFGDAFKIFHTGIGSAVDISTNGGRFYISRFGNVGIGTDSPSSLLDISASGTNNGLRIFATGSGETCRIINAGTGTSFRVDDESSDTTPFIINNAGNVGIGTSIPTYQLELSTDSAAKPSTNTWTTTSDMRLKEDIVSADISICYNTIKNLDLKYFKWKDLDPLSIDKVKDRHKLGWIAQDVESVFPKAVDTITDPSFCQRFDLPDVKLLNADQIYASMYGATKHLINKVETLESQNAALLARIDALEQQNITMMNLITSIQNSINSNS